MHSVIIMEKVSKVWLLNQNTSGFSGEDTVPLTDFAPGALFPSTQNLFYRYEGSLTTPPCYETVEWTVFQEYNTISERQVVNTSN